MGYQHSKSDYEKKLNFYVIGHWSAEKKPECQLMVPFSKCRVFEAKTADPVKEFIEVPTGKIGEMFKYYDNVTCELKKRLSQGGTTSSSSALPAGCSSRCFEQVFIQKVMIQRVSRRARPLPSNEELCRAYSTIWKSCIVRTSPVVCRGLSPCPDERHDIRTGTPGKSAL